MVDLDKVGEDISVEPAEPIKELTEELKAEEKPGEVSESTTVEVEAEAVAVEEKGTDEAAEPKSEEKPPNEKKEGSE